MTIRPGRGVYRAESQTVRAVTVGEQLQAVVARREGPTGLAPWSSGQVEGQVTRAKLLKKQGFERANLDFLRKRILLSP